MYWDPLNSNGFKVNAETLESRVKPSPKSTPESSPFFHTVIVPLILSEDIKVKRSVETVYSLNVSFKDSINTGIRSFVALIKSSGFTFPFKLLKNSSAFPKSSEGSIVTFSSPYEIVIPVFPPLVSNEKGFLEFDKSGLATKSKLPSKVKPANLKLSKLTEAINSIVS